MRHVPALAFALALVCFGAASAQGAEQDASSPRIAVKAGELTATELIYRWAIATGRLPQLDPQVDTIRVRFAEAGHIDVPNYEPHRLASASERERRSRRIASRAR